MFKGEHHIGEYLKELEKHGVQIDFSGSEKDKKQIVKYLSYNSKDVPKGTLFICKGETFKQEYLEAAVNAGAEFYISERKYQKIAVPAIVVSDIRKAMAVIANLFYNYAWKNIKILAVTGTKGKSTSAYFIKAILDDYCEARGAKKPAIISGIEIYDGAMQKEATLTTPETLELHRHIASAVENGIKYLILEVSSQSLKYHRTYGIGFDRVCLLNMGNDHISPLEHSDFEDYFSSKLKIFEQSDKVYVNLDSDYNEEICKAAEDNLKEIVSFSTGKPADFQAGQIVSEKGRTIFDVEENSKKEKICINMPGVFNVSNALAAISMCRGIGVPYENIKRGIANAKVKGRMQVYRDEIRKIHIIVDFAHNAMSFEALLRCAKEEFKAKKISAVFGATGSKALTRRYEMGKIAGLYADFSYITEDDPGEESVEKICEEIEKEIKRAGGSCKIILDRQEAIKKAIEEAAEGTVVVVAGKGEDGSQKRGRIYVKIKSDVEYVEQLIKK